MFSGFRGTQRGDFKKKPEKELKGILSRVLQPDTARQKRQAMQKAKKTTGSGEVGRKWGVFAMKG